MKIPNLSWTQNLSEFWKQFPALHFGSFFLIGIATWLHPLLFFIALPLFTRKYLIKSLCLMSCAFFYLHLLAPPLIETPLKGSALFHIKQIKQHTSPFHSSLVYEGILKGFYPEGEKALHRLPCHLYLHSQKNRPQANKDYFFKNATLIQTAPHRYRLKLQKNAPWIPVEKTHSLAESRFQTKNKAKKTVQHHYKTKRESALMTALLTGSMENRLLSFQFGQVGLQHLLAISGFHFALLSFFLMFALKSFLPPRGAATVLLILLTLYFLYMGSIPSISRAWIGIAFFLIGTLFHYRPTALNALGLALLAALLSNPLIIDHIGFQLSFGATLAILLFYPSFEKSLQRFLPKRTYEEATHLSRLDQWGYLLIAYLRTVLALNGAVLTLTLPLLLFHFHKFPLLSLFYNLFFPLLFSIVIVLLVLALFIPPLHLVNQIYTSFILNLVTNAPKRLMFYLRVPPFPLWLLATLLIGVCMWGMHSRIHMSRSSTGT